MIPLASIDWPASFVAATAIVAAIGGILAWFKIEGSTEKHRPDGRSCVEATKSVERVMEVKFNALNEKVDDEKAERRIDQAIIHDRLTEVDKSLSGKIDALSSTVIEAMRKRDR